MQQVGPVKTNIFIVEWGIYSLPYPQPDFYEFRLSGKLSLALHSPLSISEILSWILIFCLYLDRE